MSKKNMVAHHISEFGGNMEEFILLNCNMFGEKDLEMRTLRFAIYCTQRFYDSCDSITYNKHGREMEACIRNLKKMVAKMEGEQ